MLCHRYLHFRLFRERYSYGISYAIGQQSAYTYGTLDTSVFALSGLCNAEMQRVMHVFLIHTVYKKAHRANHHHRIRSFHRYHNIVKSLFLADTQKLHAAFYYALGRITVAVTNSIR